MPPSPINDYLAALRRDLRAGGTTERSHYPARKALIESLARFEPPAAVHGVAKDRSDTLPSAGCHVQTQAFGQPH